MMVKPFVDPSTLNIIRSDNGGGSFCAGCGGDVWFSICVETVEHKFYSLCSTCTALTKSAP
jgi:hypothetical protein